MHPILAKTFGGLTRHYYFRNFIFGLIFPVLLISALRHPPGVHIQTSMLALFVINTLFYPYSRFVYEGIVGFVLGNNGYIVPMLVLVFFKMMTMLLCWFFAIIIAPFGLLYLYFYHSRK